MIVLTVPVKFCAVVRRPPIGERNSLEILRFTLGLVFLGSHVIEIRTVLEGDGVYHALKDLPEKVLDRDTSRLSVVDGIDFDMLTYVVREDLEERGLSEEDLLPGVEVVPAEEVDDLIGQVKTAHFL